MAWVVSLVVDFLCGFSLLVAGWFADCFGVWLFCVCGCDFLLLGWMVWLISGIVWLAGLFSGSGVWLLAFGVACLLCGLLR